MPKTHNRIGRFPVLARLAVPAVIAGAFAPGVASAQCTGFNLVQSSGAVIVPGTTDIGNHGDDVVTSLPLPFPVAMYGVIYNSAVASSNGTLQFTTSSNAYGNICLPSPDLGVSIMPHWDDLRTDGTGEGIFTSVTGVAPNRVMNIEWRTHYYSGAGTAGFEVRLFEDQSRVEVIYGDVTNGGSSATVGIQHTLYPSVQYACNTGGVGAGTLLTYTCTNGPISPAGIGAVSPTLVYACGTSSTALFTVTVTPGFNPTSTGLAVTANLQSVGGSATQTFYDNGTNGDVTAGDRVFSFRAAIPATVTPGTRAWRLP